MSALHWIEQLDHNHEVVRVLTNGKHYVARVVVHDDRAWRVERRVEGRWLPLWQATLCRPGARIARRWRSPQAAMRAAAAQFTSAAKGPK